MLPDAIKYNSLSYYMCNCEPTLLIKTRTEQYCLRNTNSNKQPAEPQRNLHKLTGQKKSKNKPAKRDMGYRFCRFCYLHKHDVGYSFSSKRKKKKKALGTVLVTESIFGAEQSKCNILKDVQLQRVNQLLLGQCFLL